LVERVRLSGGVIPKCDIMESFCQLDPRIPQVCPLTCGACVPPGVTKEPKKLVPLTCDASSAPRMRGDVAALLQACDGTVDGLAALLPL
jgi:hypothetical protein